MVTAFILFLANHDIRNRTKNRQMFVEKRQVFVVFLMTMLSDSCADLICIFIALVGLPHAFCVVPK